MVAGIGVKCGESPVKPLEVGDRVNWLRSTSRGYGFAVLIAAVVLKIGEKRMQIRVAQRVAGVWQSETRWVEAGSLSPRKSHVPEVDED